MKMSCERVLIVLFILFWGIKLTANNPDIAEIKMHNSDYYYGEAVEYLVLDFNKDGKLVDVALITPFFKTGIRMITPRPSLSL